MSKKEIILNKVIDEYLKNNSPIGSMELKEKLELNISPSTIRVYFKKLSMEGILTQFHTSGGRIPTLEALKEYWSDKFGSVEILKISSVAELKEWIDEFKLYCMVQKEDNKKLSEIINVEERFLLILFEDKSIVLPYNKKVEKFLQSLIGYNINSVKDISLNVGLSELRKKIEQLLEEDLVMKENESILYEMIGKSDYYDYIEEFTKVSLFDKIENGVYFEELVPQGYLAVRYNALIDDTKANIFCVGRVDMDYRELIRRCA